jgi:hypothetical protein
MMTDGNFRFRLPENERFVILKYVRTEGSGILESDLLDLDSPAGISRDFKTTEDLKVQFSSSPEVEVKDYIKIS